MTRFVRSWFLSALAVALPAVVQAQTGSIAGKVTDSARVAALSQAQIMVRDAGGRNVGSAVTGSGGTYRIDRLPVGTYTVFVTLIPYAPKSFSGVSVKAGGTTTVDAALTSRAATLQEVVVVTASRVPEKLNDAPAAVHVVTSEQIQERPAMSVLDHLKTAPGISFSEGGLVQSNIVSRGFNNIFSGSMLMLIDNRYASVPSLAVNVPAFFPTTNEDIEQIEFVLGPGAALYGPNVTNGVLHIITKSPITSPGTTITVGGGYRGASPSVAGTNGADKDGGLFQASFRHAMRFSDKAGFKVSGQYMAGDDWKYADRGDTLSLGANGTTLNKCTRLATGCRDFGIRKYNGEARLDVRPDRNTEWVTSYGLSNAQNLIELTGIGAAQARNWKYQSIQSRFRHKELFVQAFGNFSNAGQSFRLRDGAATIDHSRQWVAQAQHGFNLGAKEAIIYGFDYIYTDARTEGTINGLNEGDDTIKQYGGYAHSVTKISPKFDIVSAVRVDKHSAVDKAVVSPRLALVFRPDEDNNLRLTYNRAFSTPSNNNLFLDVRAGAAGPYTVRALGVPKSGFHFRGNGGCAGGVDNLCMRAIPVPGGPTSILPARATVLWQLAVALIGNSSAVPSSLKQLLAAIPAPTTQVGTVLRLLNATTGKFNLIDPTQVRDIEQLKPTITNTLEFGYKGGIGRNARISFDAYWEKRQNFVGPLIVESPNVFLDPATLGAYLAGAFTPILGAAGAAQAAGALATGMAGLPLGTVIPNDGSPLTNRPDIFLTYRNFGSVKLWGGDVAFDYVANDRWSFNANWSFVNKDFFSAAEVNGPTDIALNGSKNRGSATVRLRNDPQGWTAEGRVRYVKGFPVNSGVYVSPQNADGSLKPTDTYGVVDLQGSLRPKFLIRNTILNVSINNVLNHAYATFVGVPQIGRMIMTSVSYSF